MILLLLYTHTIHCSSPYISAESTIRVGVHGPADQGLAEQSEWRSIGEAKISRTVHSFGVGNRTTWLDHAPESGYRQVAV